MSSSSRAATGGRASNARGALAARDTEPDTVHLVSAAATPLGGDSVCVRIVVEPGALLRVRTAAATVTLPGPTTPESHAIWTLEVAGELDSIHNPPSSRPPRGTSRRHTWLLTDRAA